MRMSSVNVHNISDKTHLKQRKKNNPHNKIEDNKSPNQPIERMVAYVTVCGRFSRKITGIKCCNN